MGTYWRNPRTQQERRANGSHEHRRVEIQVGGETYEFRIRIRGKRSVLMLVEAWHDIPREKQRSWKEHRRTQYRVKDIPPARQHGRSNADHAGMAAVTMVGHGM